VKEFASDTVCVGRRAERHDQRFSDTVDILRPGGVKL
jgi:hypothetical protein